MKQFGNKAKLQVCMNSWVILIFSVLNQQLHNLMPSYGSQMNWMPDFCVWFSQTASVVLYPKLYQATLCIGTLLGPQWLSFNSRSVPSAFPGLYHELSVTFVTFLHVLLLLSWRKQQRLTRLLELDLPTCPLEVQTSVGCSAGTPSLQPVWTTGPRNVPCWTPGVKTWPRYNMN